METEHKTYCWVTAGDVRVGTLKEYCHDTEMAHYVGEDVSELHVIEVDAHQRPTLRHAYVDSSSYSGDHWLYVTLTVDGEQATYKIDLLA